MLILLAHLIPLLCNAAPSNSITKTKMSSLIKADQTPKWLALLGHEINPICPPAIETQPSQPTSIILKERKCNISRILALPTINTKELLRNGLMEA